MKVRKGFVTNSSSSSFTVIIKERIPENKVLEYLEDILLKGISEDNIFYKLCKDLVKQFVNNGIFCETLDDIKREKYYGEDDDDFLNDYPEFKQFLNCSKFVSLIGSFCDDSGDELETLLRYYSLNYEDDKIKINID